MVQILGMQASSNSIPLVSVIVPVYNQEQYLRACLDSIRGQTLVQIEIICVDDGSTDASLAILKDYEQRDTRVKVLHQKNLYAGVARQKGMENARGKYLAFLDSDDFFEAGMLEEMVQAAERNDADVVVCGSDCYKEEEGKFIATPWNLRLDYVKSVNTDCFCPSEVIPTKIFHFVNPAPWSKLYRADFIRKHNLYWAPLQHTNDILFVCSALAMARRLSVVNKVFVHYRLLSSSISHSKKKDIHGQYAAFRALKEQLSRLGVNPGIFHSFNERLLTGVVWNLSTLDGERARELRDHMIRVYEPEFCLLDTPLDKYENKQQYRRYKALIRPLATLVVEEGMIEESEAEDCLKKMLSIKDADFDVVAITHDEESSMAKVFKHIADTDIRCTWVNTNESISASLRKFCRGRYIVPFIDTEVSTEQIRAVMLNIEKMQYLPEGVYQYEYVKLLSAQNLKEMETLAKVFKLHVQMGTLRRKYWLLKLKRAFCFGKKRKKYTDKLDEITAKITQYKMFINRW